MQSQVELNKLLIITWIIRLLPLILLFIPNPTTHIPDFYKVLLLMIWDYPDCLILRAFGYHIDKTCYFREYQIMDKASDLLTYLVLLGYFFKKKSYNDTFLGISMILFIIRAVGVFSFMETGDSTRLVRYPDFLREFWLIYLFFQDVYPGVPVTYQIIIYLLATVFKIELENIMHSKTHPTYF